jgi:hypothetical protein
MTEGKLISVTLTIKEYNVFKSLCEEFLGTYKVKISRARALMLNKILDKLEESFTKGENREDDTK